MKEDPALNSNNLTLQQIREAHCRIRPYINRTPVMSSISLNNLVGSEVYFKCENFQKVGAFKARGAHNAVFSLSDSDAVAGVLTHSSGNHAAALALAAKNRGIPAFIVMPHNAPEVKKLSVKRYGGQISFCEPTLQARESTAASLVAHSGAQFIHPYDDLRVIAAQGTTALELLEEVQNLDLIVCPIGGGGLMSGVAFTAKSLFPNIIVVGAEPKAADDAYRSFHAKKILPSLNPQTIADGLLTSLGEKTFPLISSYVDDIITVSEDEIIKAMRTVWEVMKIIIEPSAAVAVAVLLENKIAMVNKRIGVILTGGNLDLNRLPWQK
jgi:threonine dehydratase